MNPQTAIEKHIKENVLFGDGEKLSENVSFQESGILDSTGFLEIIAFIEEKFGIEITDSELIPENFDTLRKMAAFVEEKLNARASVQSAVHTG